MKLASIRLHPFGGTADRTYGFRGGLNVLEGPNEFGKSTLRGALWHGLFTPTDLTPAALRKAMGRWYPKPDGDHARITLVFEADGRRWTLEKRWGASGTASLTPDGAAGLVDPGRIRQQLADLLKRNEATWHHVLFVEQAELAGTVEDLRSSAGELDDVQALLAGAAAVPGDIAPDKLMDAVDDRVAEHFSRWDRNTSGPERGRGIDNPWARGRGPLLEVYYAREEVRRQLEEVQAYEKEVDGVNEGIKALEEGLKADREFVSAGQKIRGGLAKRDGIEERHRRLRKERDELKKVLAAWPGAEQVIKGKEEELARIARTLKALETELGHARKKAQAEKQRRDHQLLLKARSDLQAADAALRETKASDPALMDELRHLEAGIETCRIKIAAQKLSAALIGGSGAVAVTVHRGTDGPEEVELAAGGRWEGEAEGKFRVEAGDLTVSVESGTGDVAALFSKLEQGTGRRNEILEALGHDSLAAAEQAEKARGRLATDRKHKQQLYQQALQGLSEEDWAGTMAGLAALPETRSVEALEEEKSGQMQQKAKLEMEIDQQRKQVAQWRAEHEDVETLMGEIIEKQAEEKMTGAELEQLPGCPEGFPSISSYLQVLDEKEEALRDSESTLRDLKIEQARLVGEAPKATAEELGSGLEMRERDFDRQEATGQALLRIRRTLQELVAQRGTDDPLKGLADAVSRMFKELTDGRYEEVRMEGTAPVGVRGQADLDTALLSQGTLGSLALATRLALAGLYLEGLEGFLLMDDPFTDMDEGRRLAAMQAVGNFAKGRQVLIFTCHPQHAAELQDKAEARPCATR